jgi:hypothetical protein
MAPNVKLLVKVGRRMIDAAFEAVNSIVQILAVISIEPSASLDRCRPQSPRLLAPELG